MIRYFFKDDDANITRIIDLTEEQSKFLDWLEDSSYLSCYVTFEKIDDIEAETI